MAISNKTRKMLWGRSGNRCAVCKKELIFEATSKDEESIVGDECHIFSKKQGGPRYSDSHPSKHLDDYSNLILLCKIHHKMIDDQANEYTVDYLKKIKKEHEMWVSETLGFSFNQSQKPNPEDGNPDKEKFLFRLQSGKEVLNVILGADIFEIDQDEIDSEKDLKIVKEFVEWVVDSDVLTDLDASCRIQFSFDLKDCFQRLEKNGFWVFGRREKRKLKVFRQIEMVECAVLRILYSSNPEIIQLGDAAKDSSINEGIMDKKGEK